MPARKHITPEVIKKAGALASQGLTHDQIALCLGMGDSTLYEKEKAYPELSESIKEGRAKGVATIANALFNSAKGGNITAQIFYLKNRSPNEWSERQEVDLNVTNLPEVKVSFVEPDKK